MHLKMFIGTYAKEKRKENSSCCRPHSVEQRLRVLNASTDPAHIDDWGEEPTPKEERKLKWLKKFTNQPVFGAGTLNLKN